MRIDALTAMNVLMLAIFNLKMEVVRSSETLVSTHKFTRNYNPEDQYRYMQYRAEQETITEL
jgi:hypothetical protein